MAVIEIGEHLRVVKRRFFVDGVRLPFMGGVRGNDENVLRLISYVWVFDLREGKYIRRREKRDSIFVLGDMPIINVRPRAIPIEPIIYAIDASR